MALQTYDVAVAAFSIVLDVFFREIKPRGSHKVPRDGPVIFVAAPHANQ
ncbi:16466_t:CDS:1, partial [Dentiscutata heterogama]